MKLKFNSTSEAKQFIEQRKEVLQSLLKCNLGQLEREKEALLTEFAHLLSKLENLEESLLAEMGGNK